MVEPLSDDRVRDEMRQYMAEVGWDKVLGHRGISAGRTVEKMTAWLWLLGDDEMVRFAEDDSNYPQYGAPILKAICEKYGFPIPDDPAARRMAVGRRCVPDCDEGCAR